MSLHRKLNMHHLGKFGPGFGHGSVPVLAPITRIPPSPLILID